MSQIYRGMDQATLDLAYNNSAHVGQAKRDALILDWITRSAQVRHDHAEHQNLPYGTGMREVIDFLHCGRSNAPTLAFIHGGYWQSSDKDTYLFLAKGPMSKGFHFANIEYTLAPEKTMDGIVDEIRRATQWLLDNLPRLGGDASKLYVAGHSAGGHLTAIAMENPQVAGGLAISGLFDLEPIRLCYLNKKLAMDAFEARRNSPIHRLPQTSRALWITAGGGELSELQRQSVEYFASRRKAGLPVEFVPTLSHDHFSILEELALPEGYLSRTLAALAADESPPAF